MQKSARHSHDFREKSRKLAFLPLRLLKMAESSSPPGTPPPENFPGTPPSSPPVEYAPGTPEDFPGTPPSSPPPGTPENAPGTPPSSPPPAEEPTEEHEWSAFYDAEGNIYYYNSVSGESSWDAPEKFNPPPPEDEVAAGTGTDEPQQEVETEAETGAEAEAGAKRDEEAANEEYQEADQQQTSDWVAYEDDEGREYYYNSVTDETQWEKPEGYVAKAPPEEEAAAEEAEPSSPTVEAEDSSTAVAMETAETAEREEAVEEKEPERSPSPVEDPAVKRLREAEEALKQADAVIEPGCVGNVKELVTSEGVNPQMVIQALIDSFLGQTSICGLIARWLADFKSKDKLGPSGGAFQGVANEIRETAQDVVNKIAKERFTKTGGDSILNLSKSEAAFLEDMMDSDRWRKLLIDLSATNKGSAVLMYCQRALSKRGYHREMAKRINVSDSFSVFNAMLQSELTVVGRSAISAISEQESSISLGEIVSDLRRTCTSTAYTYLFAIEVLRHLVTTAKVEARSLQSLRFRRATRKWERLYQDLDSALMDPSSITSTAESPIFRKRRLDVSLTVSELQQRKRRRPKPTEDDDDDDNNAILDNDKRLTDLEAGLLSFLRRHAIGTRVDDAVLDAILKTDLNMNLNATDHTGRVLISCPLAIRALLSHVFMPGSSRSSLSTKNKCARLIALAVLAAEKQAKSENEEEGAEVSSESEEVSLTRMLVEGSNLCEQVENMVSFLVTTTKIDSNNGKQGGSNSTTTSTNSTPGENLCNLCLKCAPIAQGAMIWAKGVVKQPEFMHSTQYPTFSPCVLSLVRLISMKHPCTRPYAVEIAFVFLQQSSTGEISYKRMHAIKQQSLRLLLFLLVKGEIVSVLRQFTVGLQSKDDLKLDASLIRYFVEGLLDIVRPPLSLPFVRLLGTTLKEPKIMDAVRSSYFKDAYKKLLTQLLSNFQESIRREEGSVTTSEDKSLLSFLLSTYA